jgi:dipeptidyl-peptidase-4
LKIINDGKAFTWLSDRTDWRHIYLVSLENGKIQPVTSGEFDVVDIVGVDQANQWLYFRASPDNPTQLYLYRTTFDGSRPIERLSPSDKPGYHALQLSPKAKWAIHKFSSFEQPSVISLVSLLDFHQAKVLQSNDELQQKVAALSIQPVEFFQIPISEDVALDAWCLKPADFDPDIKYPLLFYIYGEPSGLTAVDSWGGSKNLWHMMLVQQGFIIISVDSSGSAAPRGRSWRKSMYRHVGTKSAADQAASARVLLQQRPYLDPDRVGIWGWSGGGTMTLNMLFRYPEIYKTGVAVASVSDQRLYDSIYQERYMGLLEDNEAGYIDGSPITHVEKLTGNLLLIHGTGDDNVHYQCHERLVNELIKYNKRFSMMTYPNRTHGINEGENTTYHLHDLMTRYLVEHLLQETPTSSPV